MNQALEYVSLNCEMCTWWLMVYQDHTNEPFVPYQNPSHNCCAVKEMQLIVEWLFPSPSVSFRTFRFK